MADFTTIAEAQISLEIVSDGMGDPDALDSAISAINERIDPLESQAVSLGQAIESTQKFAEDNSLISKDYAAITEDSLSLGKNGESTFANVSKDSIQLVNEKGVVAEIRVNNDAGEMRADNTQFSTIKMRANDDQTTGALTWIAQSNGHLSLKVVV